MANFSNFQARPIYSEDDNIAVVTNETGAAKNRYISPQYSVIPAFAYESSALLSATTLYCGPPPSVIVVLASRLTPSFSTWLICDLIVFALRWRRILNSSPRHNNWIGIFYTFVYYTGEALEMQINSRKAGGDRAFALAINRSNSKVK